MLMANEYTIHLNIETLPEGQYLATSEDILGLVAQGRTVAETIEIAQDVARKLIDSLIEHGDPLPPRLCKVANRIEIDVAVGF
jgi:predicted RNase H-like HicB family nuclease